MTGRELSRQALFPDHPLPPFSSFNPSTNQTFHHSSNQPTNYQVSPTSQFPGCLKKRIGRSWSNHCAPIAEFNKPFLLRWSPYSVAVAMVRYLWKDDRWSMMIAQQLLLLLISAACRPCSDDHIRWSYRMIISDGHIGWSYRLIISDGHIGWS